MRRNCCSTTARGRLAAGKRIARREDGAHRGSVAGAARRARNGSGGQPLDAVLPPLPRAAKIFQPAECFSLHHGANGLCQPDGNVSGAGVWAVADSPFARTADRTIHPRRRPAGAQEKSRHANDGRRADRAVDCGACFAMGGSDECVCADGVVCPDWFFGDRIHRRLREGRKKAEPRTYQQAQISFTGAGQHDGGCRIAGAFNAQRVLDAADRSVLEKISSRSGDSLTAVERSSVVAGVSALSACS